MQFRLFRKIDWAAPGLPNKLAVASVVVTLLAAIMQIVFGGSKADGEKSAVPQTLPPSVQATLPSTTPPPPVAAEPPPVLAQTPPAPTPSVAPSPVSRQKQQEPERGDSTKSHKKHTPPPLKIPDQVSKGGDINVINVQGDQRIESVTYNNNINHK